MSPQDVDNFIEFFYSYFGVKLTPQQVELVRASFMHDELIVDLPFIPQADYNWWYHSVMPSQPSQPTGIVFDEAHNATIKFNEWPATWPTGKEDPWKSWNCTSLKKVTELTGESVASVPFSSYFALSSLPAGSFVPYSDRLLSIAHGYIQADDVDEVGLAFAFLQLRPALRFRADLENWTRDQIRQEVHS